MASLNDSRLLKFLDSYIYLTMIVSMTMTVYDVDRVSDFDSEAPEDYDAQTADDLDSKTGHVDW